jgi:hypothetical protein
VHVELLEPERAANAPGVVERALLLFVLATESIHQAQGAASRLDASMGASHLSVGTTVPIAQYRRSSMTGEHRAAAGGIAVVRTT